MQDLLHYSKSVQVCQIVTVAYFMGQSDQRIPTSVENKSFANIFHRCLIQHVVDVF